MTIIQIQIIYLSRVKYLITGGPVVYIMALNKNKKHKNKNHTDPTNYYTSKQIIKIHYKNQKVLLILKCSCEEFSLIKLFCCIFLKFEWEIIFLYVPPRLFHRQHALEWKFLSPEFLLHDGVKLQI